MYRYQPERILLVVFYGISTLIDYLMPNLVYTSILNIRFVNKFVVNILK